LLRSGCEGRPPCACALQIGAYTVAGVQRMTNEVLGSSTSQNDLNGDGVVNLADLQIVVKAVMTGVCVTQ
jgi:hypothetical protein